MEKVTTLKEDPNRCSKCNESYINVPLKRKITDSCGHSMCFECFKLAMFVPIEQKCEKCIDCVICKKSCIECVKKVILDSPPESFNEKENVTLVSNEQEKHVTLVNDTIFDSENEDENETCLKNIV